MSEMTDALWSFFEQEVAPQIMSFQLNDPDQTSPAQVRIICIIAMWYVYTVLWGMKSFPHASNTS